MKHLTHYLSLLGIIGAGFWGLSVFSYDKAFQSAVILAAGTSFVVWGVVHHFLNDDLHLRVVLEYIMTATLGIVILLSVVWSA